MYTTDYLKTFGDTLALPAESRAPLAADYETLLAAPGAAAEMQAAESLNGPPSSRTWTACTRAAACTATPSIFCF